MVLSLLELRQTWEQEWNNGSLPGYLSDRLRDMNMVNRELLREEDIRLSLTIWLLGCSIIII